MHQALYIVFSRVGIANASIQTSKIEVAREHFCELLWFGLPFFVNVFGSKAEINKIDLTFVLQVMQHVLRLDIIMKIADIVKTLNAGNL